MASNAAAARKVVLPLGVSALLHTALMAVFFVAPESSESQRPAPVPLVWLSSGVGPTDTEAASAAGDGATDDADDGGVGDRGALGESRRRRTAASAQRAARAGGPPAEHTDPSAEREDAPARSVATPDALPGAPTEAQAGLLGEGSDDAVVGGGTADGAEGEGRRGGHGAGSAAGEGEGAGEGAGHGPTLLAWSNPCAGFFPSGAHTPHGSVQVEVDVAPNGHAAGARVVVEQPRGEGFAGAARACAERLRFTPATSSAGTPVAGRARLLLRFDRS